MAEKGLDEQGDFIGDRTSSRLVKAMDGNKVDAKFTFFHLHNALSTIKIHNFKIQIREKKQNPKNSASLISKYNRSKYQTSNPIKPQNQEEKKTFHFNHAKPPKLVQEPKSRQTSPKLVKKRSNIQGRRHIVPSVGLSPH